MKTTGCPYLGANRSPISKPGDPDLVNKKKTISQALQYLLDDPSLINFFEGKEKDYLYVIIAELTKRLQIFLSSKYEEEIHNRPYPLPLSPLSKKSLETLVKGCFTVDAKEWMEQADDETKKMFRLYDILRNEGTRIAMGDEMSDVQKGMEVGFSPLVNHFLTIYYRSETDPSLLNTPPPVVMQNAIQGLQYSNINALVGFILLIHEIKNIDVQQLSDLFEQFLTEKGNEMLDFHSMNISFIEFICDKLFLSPDESENILTADYYHGIVDSNYKYLPEHKHLFGRLTEVIMSGYEKGLVNPFLMMSTMSLENPEAKIFGCPAIPYFKNFWEVLKVYVC